ncbi:MAG: Fe2+-dependent dioxygenase [Pseudomonadota bacterium]
MILCLDSVLSTAEVAAMNETLADATFIDGTFSAGAGAAGKKHNQQLPPDNAHALALARKVETALREHPVAAAAALPHRFSPIRFSRYQRDMAYGPHFDEAIIGGVRSDLSFTLFLSEPESYTGGELCITSPAGIETVRLDPGCAVLYPAGAIHEVLPVKQGARLAAVGWIQSEVPDASAREVLLELARVQTSLPETAGQARLQLGAIRARLRRRWSQI